MTTDIVDAGKKKSIPSLSFAEAVEVLLDAVASGDTQNAKRAVMRLNRLAEVPIADYCKYSALPIGGLQAELYKIYTDTTDILSATNFLPLRDVRVWNIVLHRGFSSDDTLGLEGWEFKAREGKPLFVATSWAVMEKGNKWAMRGPFKLGLTEELREEVFVVLMEWEPREPAAVAAGPVEPSKRIPAKEANIKARDILKDNPDISLRELANKIQCSHGLAGKLPAWKARQEVRQEESLSQQKTKRVKTIALTDELQSLISEQASDAKTDNRRGRIRQKF